MEIAGKSFVIIWKYIIDPQFREEFETAYQSDGEWGKFFQRDSAYLGTSLHRDVHNGNGYITIDYWSNQDAYLQFLARWQKEYELLDVKFEGWTRNETLIGKFNSG